MPILGKAAFTCPHCKAIAHQYWYQVRADQYDKGKSPIIPDDEFIDLINGEQKFDDDHKNRLVHWVNRMRAGEIFTTITEWKSSNIDVHNLCLSRCYSCDHLLYGYTIG